MVLEDESAFTRGRIPAHELKITLETSIVLLQAKANQSRNQARMFEMELDCESDVFLQQSSLHMAVRSYMSMIQDHYMSYDQYSRPYKFYELPRVMAHSFTCPIRNHDALVLRNSSMILMLSNVFINGDLNRPAVTVTDKAYGRTEHFKPIHTDAELQMMNRVDRELALQFDKKHKKPRMAVEYSFNQQITKFRHSDDYRRHKITQSGSSNWNYLRCLWDLQTLFFNLYTCSAGSQVTGALGVNPPTIHEYLF